MPNNTRPRWTIFSFVLCLALSAPPVLAAVTISYAELVDESPLTHAGQSVGDVVMRLKFTTDPELKTVTSEQIAEWRKAYDEALRTGEITAEDYEEKKQILEAFASIRKDASPERIRALKGLVEPFLEPYSYVLESYVRSRGNDPRPPLIDVGDLYPAGTAQPAWAYLVRTRRYHVLTDGDGFVRMYVPGQSSAAAYKKHYPLLRHVLGFLYRSSERKGLDVEVYAYTNDFAALEFRLDDTPHKVTIRSEPARPAGTIALPLAGLEQFLRDGLTIEGASLSPTGELALLGTKQSAVPTVEGQPLTLADLAVAYRAAAYSGFNDVYISLDPSSNPGMANVNFGGGLEDTRIGWVTLRADMRFKTIGDGFDAVSGQDLSPELVESVPGFQTQQMRYFEANPNVTSESTRFWFYPDEIELTENETGTLMRIVRPRYTPAAERQEAWSDDAELTGKTPSWTADAIAHLEENYDRYAAVFPEFGELDTVGRLLSTATWLHKKNAGRTTRLDLDELLDVELPACSTPRRRPQLYLTYWVSKENGKVLAYNATHVTEPAWDEFDGLSDETQPLAAAMIESGIALAGLRFLKQRDPQLVLTNEFEPEGYHTYSVVTGGLDLDVAKRMPRKASMAANDGKLLGRVSASGAGEDVPGNGSVWRRSPKGGGESRSLPMWVRREATKEIPAKTRTAIRNDTRTFAAEVASGEPSGWQSRGSATMAGRVETLTQSGDAPPVFARRSGAEPIRYSLKGSGKSYSAERLPDVIVAPEEQLRAVEAAARAPGSAAEDIWKVLPADTPVVAVDTAADGTVAVLSGPRNAYRLDYMRDGAIVRTATDDALAQFEAISSARIQTAGDGTRRFLYVTKNDATGDIVMELGSKRARTDELFFSEALDGLLKEAADEGVTDVIVYRDALDRRPPVYGGSLRRSSGSDPLELVAHINETTEHPLRAHLANDVDLALAHLDTMGGIRSRDNVAVVMAGADANIETHGLNARVRGVLKESGLPIADDLSAVGAKSDVILIWGHNDKALEVYLTSAGEAGHLKGKVMLLSTCFAEGNANFFQTLVKNYGATAVMIHGERIAPVALQRVLLEVPGILRSAEVAQETIDPARLLAKAAEKVLQDPTISDQLRATVEKLLRSGLQISENLEHEGEVARG